VRKRLVSIWAIGALFSSSAFAQTEDAARYDRALAAGYKAQFICSGLWNGGKSLAAIKADELSGIYDRIADIVPALLEEVDETGRAVRVRFADDAPPRIAVWNNKTGCTAMPIGFDGASTGSAAKTRIFADDQAWPMGDLNAVAHPAAGSNSLKIAAERAFQPEAYGGKTSAVLVLQKGKIRAEKYQAGHDLHTAQRTWSVAKSIAGTLVGHSVQQQMVDIHAPAKIAEWQQPGDPRAMLTIDNLMRMSSGLTSDTAGNRTDPVYMGGASVAQRATSWPLLYRPGTRFRYANNDILLAVLASQAHHRDRKDMTGNTMPAAHDFDPHGFFQKLGMTRTYAETDWQGNYILSSQVWSTAHDLARLGQLYLNDGKLRDGTRVLPEGWVKYVSTPAGPQPDGPFGYGAGFWLLNKSDGVPPDTFAAFGNRGQYVVIVPSRNVVIVRRGEDPVGARFDIAAFTRDVLAALE